MKRLALILGAVIVGATLAADCPAENPVFPQGQARRSMGNLLPGTSSPQASAPTARPNRTYPNRVYYYPRYGSAYRSPSYRDPYYYDDYGYDNYGDGGYDYRYVYPHRRPRYYPPVFIPAETLYGPNAVKRFMGFGGVRPQANVFVPPLVAGPVANPVAGPIAGPVGNPLAGAVVGGPDLIGAAEAKALATAQKYIGYGDTHFQNEKYADAYIRYRRAVREAPDLPDGYFREGYALVAQGKYELAARAFKQGLALDPAWPGSGFSSRQLYGNNDTAMKAHVEALAAAAEKAPDDPDPMFLLGVLLHFDGQPNRAELFFGQATRLNRGDDAHLQAFAARN